MTGERPAAEGTNTAVGWLEWHRALRALREARGVTQEGWSALLGVGRTTLQRWESGRTVPDIRAEDAIIELCREQGLFRGYNSGPFRGINVTAELLQELLAEARLGTEPALGRGSVDAAQGRPDTTPPGQLIESEDDHELRRHDLHSPAVTLGRSLDNDVVIEHPRVSRHHARVIWEGASYVLYDLNSTNGTFLNGERISGPEPLRDEDVILLGGPDAPRLVLRLPDQTVTAVGGASSPPD